MKHSSVVSCYTGSVEEEYGYVRTWFHVLTDVGPTWCSYGQNVAVLRPSLSISPGRGNVRRAGGEKNHSRSSSEGLRGIARGNCIREADCGRAKEAGAHFVHRPTPDTLEWNVELDTDLETATTPCRKVLRRQGVQIRLGGELLCCAGISRDL